MDMQQLLQGVLQFTPDKKADPLIDKDEHIGKPLDRVDGQLKVSGRALYAAEYDIKNVAHAVVKYSAIAKGKIISIDTTEAEALQGVIAVLTYKNMPKMPPPPEIDPGCGDKGSAPDKLPVMQDAKIHWNGQPVAVVVAETLEQAEYGASIINVAYEKERAETSFDSLKPNAKVPPQIMGEKSEIKVGDAETQLKGASCHVDEVYKTPRHNHNAIELHSTLAWFKEGDELLVFDTTQNLHALRTTFAKTFKLSPEKITIINPFVGGAFGGKGAMWQPTLLCVAAAKIANRPVKLVTSREGLFRTVGGRTLSEQRVAIGSDIDNKFVAVIHQGITAMVKDGGMVEPFSFPARFMYEAQSFLIDQKVVAMDTLANTFMRAPGESIGTFALECAVDELAHKLSIDPIELRMLNEPQKDPVKGVQFSRRNLREAYVRGAEAFKWSQKPPRTQEQGQWLIGQGVASATYPYNRFPATAQITLSAEGRAYVKTATHEMGMGTATVQIQHTAERLGLALEQITFEYGNTNLPQSPGAGGSNQTASVAASIAAACETLKRELIILANRQENSPVSSISRERLALKNGGLYSIDDDKIGLSYVSILKQAGLNELSVQGTSEKPLERMKYSMHSYGAQFCEVKVNKVTGEVRINRWLGSFDVGKILNKKTAESQFRGGIIMGIGMALMEETLFDERTGRIVNPSMSEYHVPVHLDVPKIEIVYLNEADEHSPLGAHGIGEIGITGAGAAVANAVFNATGVRVRDLPITLDKLLPGL